MSRKPELLTDRFAEAAAYCAMLHRDQTRKFGATPYVAHLFSVSALVLEDGGDEDEAIAALLHDALEDRPEKTSAEEIRMRFGERVLSMVQACTDTPPDYQGGEKPPWRERKEAHLEHLRQRSNRVALADKVHNGRALLAAYRAEGERVWEAFNAGRDEQLWYWRSVVGAFRDGRNEGQLLEELERVVEELSALASAP